MGTVENITKAASFMKVSPGKIRYNSEKIITRYVPKTNESISGYSSILQSLARESKNELIRDIYKDIETELQVVQWIDYSVLFVSPAAKDKHVLKALLEVRSSCSCFVPSGTESTDGPACDTLGCCYVNGSHQPGTWIKVKNIRRQPQKHRLLWFSNTLRQDDARGRSRSSGPVHKNSPI
ncbi:uncharacterized protein LOC131682771 isoform X2 [Topomyia yanbarensis]|uniref:uncharacterized protein LOC131682771 isoform X2 n=1 Tax=Topomyia yanbarensis TaxID=2498891 RepID=UPI00273C80E6|nr:uncharacterized protein LOC131682771 isoform X2 [Topomyia yanbarensis]